MHPGPPEKGGFADHEDPQRIASPRGAPVAGIARPWAPDRVAGLGSSLGSESKPVRRPPIPSRDRIRRPAVGGWLAACGSGGSGSLRPAETTPRGEIETGG